MSVGRLYEKKKKKKKKKKKIRENYCYNIMKKVYTVLKFTLSGPLFSLSQFREF